MNSRMVYLVVIEKTRTGYSAYVPDLPGCVAAARTRAETMRLMREATVMHLHDMRARGLRIPRPRATTEMLQLQQA